MTKKKNRFEIFFVFQEEEAAEDKKPPVNERLIPGTSIFLRIYQKDKTFEFLEFVFILEASNDHLRQRIMHLPEKVVAGTHNTELEFKRRLKTYHDLGDDGHPTKFFDDVDRPAEVLSKNQQSFSFVFSIR